MKKADRLLIRLSEDDKAHLRLAAQADGRSISSFVLRAALAAVPGKSQRLGTARHAK
jgi:uncharacterized protein (DUF1778 family)